MEIDTRTTSQKWADKITEFSGSWAFIGWFTLLCIGWIGLNSFKLGSWDPYPFLFLNWILTIISTFQNPLILLSQNRQNDVDRERMKDILLRLSTLQESIDKLNEK